MFSEGENIVNNSYRKRPKIQIKRLHTMWGRSAYDEYVSDGRITSSLLLPFCKSRS